MGISSNITKHICFGVYPDIQPQSAPGPTTLCGFPGGWWGRPCANLGKVVVGHKFPICGTPINGGSSFRNDSSWGSHAIFRRLTDLWLVFWAIFSHNCGWLVWSLPPCIIQVMTMTWYWKPRWLWDSSFSEIPMSYMWWKVRFCWFIYPNEGRIINPLYNLDVLILNIIWSILAYVQDRELYTSIQDRDLYRPMMSGFPLRKAWP
jgi:hypothetical protein